MGEPVSTLTGQREQRELKRRMSQVKVVRLPVIRTERSGIDLARRHLHAANRHNVVELRWVRLNFISSSEYSLRVSARRAKVANYSISH
jgi:hypothetical protein